MSVSMAQRFVARLEADKASFGKARVIANQIAGGNSKVKSEITDSLYRFYSFPDGSKVGLYAAIHARRKGVRREVWDATTVETDDGQ